MAKTTSKSTKPETTAAEKPSIPLMGGKGGSALDKLKSLAAAKPAEKKKASEERAELPLSEEGMDAFRDYAPAKQLQDVVSARVDALKETVNRESFKAWAKMVWKHGKPKSPLLRYRRPDDNQIDAEAMYIVQEKFKVQVPDNDNPQGSVHELLKNLGVKPEKATELVQNEVDFEPQVGLRSFTELVNGSYKDRVFVESSPEEKAVGEKLLNLVMEHLTDEEKALVLNNIPKTTVKKGFLDRVRGYATSEDELAAIFNVFQPVNYPKGAKFAVSDNPVVKTERLLQEAGKLLGSADLDSDE